MKKYILGSTILVVVMVLAAFLHHFGFHGLLAHLHGG